MNRTFPVSGRTTKVIDYALTRREIIGLGAIVLGSLAMPRGVALADSDKIQGYRSGAVDYISVPVIPEVLRAKVSIFAELHRKRRQLCRADLRRASRRQLGRLLSRDAVGRVGSRPV